MVRQSSVRVLFITRVGRSDNHRIHLVKVRLAFRAACGLEAGSLDLGADHLLAQVLLSPKKEFMIVATGIVSAGEALQEGKIQWLG